MVVKCDGNMLVICSRNKIHSDEVHSLVFYILSYVYVTMEWQEPKSYLDNTCNTVPPPALITFL